MIASVIAALAALWAAFEARRSAGAARRASAATHELAALERQRRVDEMEDAARRRRLDLAQITVEIIVKQMPDMHQAAVHVHNRGAHAAKAFRVRGRLTFGDGGLVIGEDTGWPFLSRQDAFDDIDLDQDRSISLALFDLGAAPATPIDLDRRLSYEILYRDADGPHRLKGKFDYGMRDGNWVVLGPAQHPES